jgi:hypothetical protein
MIFKIDDIEIELAEKNKGIRLTTHNDDNIILPNQTMDSVENIVKENFQIVKSYYQAKLGVSASVDKHDINAVSLKIVLYYLYMYNMWRKMYENHRDRDLKFLAKDFENPNTSDRIIWYFKKKYPKSYSAKCELMLSLSPDEFKRYEKKRQEFDDMW